MTVTFNSPPPLRLDSCVIGGALVIAAEECHTVIPLSEQ
jgi:hypothetical protein